MGTMDGREKEILQEWLIIRSPLRNSKQNPQKHKLIKNIINKICFNKKMCFTLRRYYTNFVFMPYWLVKNERINAI